MTLDDLVLEIYTDMKKAFADGNALVYANKLAQKIMIVEGSRETVSRAETTRPVISQPRPVQPAVEVREELREVPRPPARTNTATEQRDNVRVSRG